MRISSDTPNKHKQAQIICERAADKPARQTSYEITGGSIHDPTYSQNMIAPRGYYVFSGVVEEAPRSSPLPPDAARCRLGGGVEISLRPVAARSIPLPLGWRRRKFATFRAVAALCRLGGSVEISPRSAQLPPVATWVAASRTRHVPHRCRPLPPVATWVAASRIRHVPPRCRPLPLGWRRRRFATFRPVAARCRLLPPRCRPVQCSPRLQETTAPGPRWQTFIIEQNVVRRFTGRLRDTWSSQNGLQDPRQHSKGRIYRSDDSLLAYQKIPSFATIVVPGRGAEVNPSRCPNSA